MATPITSADSNLLWQKYTELDDRLKAVEVTQAKLPEQILAKTEERLQESEKHWTQTFTEISADIYNALANTAKCLKISFQSLITGKNTNDAIIRNDERYKTTLNGLKQFALSFKATDNAVEFLSNLRKTNNFEQPFKGVFLKSLTFIVENRLLSVRGPLSKYFNKNMSLQDLITKDETGQELLASSLWSEAKDKLQDNYFVFRAIADYLTASFAEV